MNGCRFMNDFLDTIIVWALADDLRKLVEVLELWGCMANAEIHRS